MHFVNEIQYDFKDVLIKPKRSSIPSRKLIDLNRTIRGKWNPDIEFSGIPIIGANMDNITTWEMADKILENNLMIAMNKFISLDEWHQHINIVKECGGKIMYSIGLRNETEYKVFKALRGCYPNLFDTLVIDVPNGYTERFGSYIKAIRDDEPKIFIIAGNVVSAEMTEHLLISGADAVKVGIGSGNCCKTRIKTGVGRPQLSAIIECADVAHGNQGHIISDGGCTDPGDVAKAFCGGADFVMLGSMFAGHDECEGEIVIEHHLSHYDREPSPSYKYNPVYKIKKFKEFWGMSSSVAMKKHYGEKAQYRTSEGRVVRAPYRGPVQDTIDDILGGLRSTCTYIGARVIKDMPKCATFYPVNRQVSKSLGEGDE